MSRRTERAEDKTPWGSVMRVFMAMVVLLLGAGAGAYGYLSHVADTMTPEPETVRVEVPLDLPR